MKRIHTIVVVISALALTILVLSIALDRWRSSPGLHQIDVGLDGGVPATVYYAGTGSEAEDFVSDARPGIVLAHGYAFDRNTMALLAESLAHAGYTVVSIDESGHGMNRNPYRTDFVQADFLASDIKAGVEFLHHTSRIEMSQIVVAGHSQGALAALAYGSHEPAVGGLILISGSREILGPRPLQNVLLLYAEREFPDLERRIMAVAANLAKVARIDPGKTYGDISVGTAVRVVQIPGTGHGSIVTSPDAFAEVVAWADAVTRQPTRTQHARLVETPVSRQMQWILLLIALPGLGMLLALLSPAPTTIETTARWPDFVLLATAALLPLILVAERWPGLLFSMSDADANVTHLALAGVLLTAWLVLAGRLPVVSRNWAGAIVAALAGWLLLSRLVAPISTHFHGVGLTPEKAFLFVWMTACLFPLAFAFQQLLNRDRWWQGILLRLAGRFAVLLAVAAGLAFGSFGIAGVITIFVLLCTTAAVEPVLAGLYARSGNLTTGAAFEASVTAWLFALLLPSNF